MMWVFEVLTQIIPFKLYGLEILEQIFDVCNELQGILIFCVFMLKRKFYLALKKKVGLANLTKLIDTDTLSALTSSIRLRKQQSKSSAE